MKGFFEQVYEVVGRIPRGKVATYGQIGAMLGKPRGARVVGWAMQAAPRELKLPCHRVINRQGTMAPGDIFGGAEVQRAILMDEGVEFMKDGRVDMGKSFWNCEL